MPPLPLLPPQGTHHKRRQHGEDLPHLPPVETAHLTDGVLRSALPAAENMAEDSSADTATATATAKKAGHIVENGSVVVAVEGPGQGAGPLGVGTVFRQCGDQHRQGAGDGLGGGIGGWRRPGG